MVNYYNLLNIDKNMSEEKLINTLKKNQKLLKLKKDKVKGEEKKYVALAEALTKIFLMTINHYGSKENYDKALEKSHDRIVRIKRFGKRNIKKFVLVGSLSAVVAGGIIGFAATHEVVEVSVKDDSSIEQICEDYGIKKINFRGYQNFGELVAKFLVNNEKAEEIKQKELEKEFVYAFDYIVKPGDTHSGLLERYNASSINGSTGSSSEVLWAGEKVVINSHDKNIAQKMQEEYNNYMKKQEKIETDLKTPESFDEYTIMPGDTLAEIAIEYGVTCNQIMEFNPQIKNIYEIYAGDTLKIPQYSKNKVK